MKDILGKYARERNGREFVYGRVGTLELYLYPKDDPTNVNETNLKRLLSELERVEVNYHSSIEKAKTELLSLSPSVAKQYKSRGQETAEGETRLRSLTKIQHVQNLSKTRVAVYGLSTEGYSIACQMAMRGANVFIIDESLNTAISLKNEIAKTYPNISSLKEDEPMLALEPIDTAISKSQYLFFAPRIRKTGRESMKETHSKFEDAVSVLKKGSSVIYALPTGIGGNDENILILENATGLDVGKSIFYYYYPLISDSYPQTILGAYKNKQDSTLADLLGIEQREAFSIPEAERAHAMSILSRFSKIYSTIQTNKFTKEESAKAGLTDEYDIIFLDDMMSGLYDLKLLSSSLAESDWIVGFAKDSIKALDEYVQHLLEEIRASLKKNNLKPEATRVELAWSVLDVHEMRGDKTEMLQNLVTKVKDIVSDVEILDETVLDIPSNKHTILVACSRKDYENSRKMTEKIPRTSLIASPTIHPK